MNNFHSSTFKPASLKTIVAHYHLFKNAGTSVDAILAENFGSNWQEIEFKKTKQRSNSHLVRDWICQHPHLAAFSSHTALFPVPTIANINLIPIVFLRHPIIRLWSVYKFERKHKKILNESIQLAQKCDFAGYLNYQLDRPLNRSCRNFQTYRFSRLDAQDSLTELERALNGLNSLSTVGIVEKFERSMKYYCQAIASYYPSFKFKLVHKNITTSHNISIAEKLDQISSHLDRATYQRLLEANSDDLQLYDAATKKLALKAKESQANFI